jgi:hypothetical protein
MGMARKKGKRELMGEMMQGDGVWGLIITVLKVIIR